MMLFCLFVSCSRKPKKEEGVSLIMRISLLISKQTGCYRIISDHSNTLRWSNMKRQKNIRHGQFNFVWGMDGRPSFGSWHFL